MSFFILQDPIQVTMLHLIIKSPQAPLADPDNFQEQRSGVYKMSLNLVLSDVFLMIRVELWILGERL